MNAHLAKPIDPETLIDLLMQWLGPQRQGQGQDHGGVESSTAAPTRAAPHPGRPDGIDRPGRSERQPARLDRAEALARMGGDAQVLAKLLKRFMDSHRDSAAVVRVALLRGEPVAATELLHRMAGAAASLGLTDLGRSASVFELSLRAPGALGATADLEHLVAELTDQLRQAGALVDAELALNPARPARLVLRANGELQEGANGAPSPPRVSPELHDSVTTPAELDALEPAQAPASRVHPRADAPAAAKADTTELAAHADPQHSQRRASARRLLNTLEALQPLLRERDLVPRELLDGLDRHTEAWAVTLDPRAPAGAAGAMADAAGVIETLAVLGEQLDAYDYPQAETALQRALQQMRILHA
jgi:HPt (histidine-containing phosphotransfer) domain-containing protein